jgi:large subunit ribosomal protein L25
MLTLNIEKRQKTERLPALRKSGKMPAVYYGKKETSTPISIKQGDFLKVWKLAGETTIISLKSSTGGAHEIEALIKDVDVDPVSGAFRHADFYAIEKGKKLEISIPLHFVGTAPAVKELGGILVKVLHQIKIEALPKDLPQHIEVDIAALATFESQILAQDLKLPAGVDLKEKVDEVVASVAKPVEEKEEDLAAPDLSAIEVEKKGKKDEEGAEGDGAASGGAGAKAAGAEGKGGAAGGKESGKDSKAKK